MGSYFITFKYVFSFLFLLWAVSLLRWPHKLWFVTGVLLLAGTSLLALQNPLGRPYGVVADGKGLEQLGEVMVVAARGTASEGRMVGDAHLNPLWGLIVAALSGFRPERLLQLYPWLPLLSLLALGLAVAWSAGTLHELEDLPRGTLSGLATFVVLFLSSHRLSFLRPEGPFWTEFFWLTPGIGIAFAALCVCWRFLAASSRSSALWAALALGFVGCLEPRLAACFGIGAVVWMVWMVATGRKVWREGTALALGTALFMPFGIRTQPASLPAEMGSWHDGVNRVLSVTLDLGLVFLLAVFGVLLLLQSGRKTERLLACCTGAALLTWTLVSFCSYVGEALDPRLVNGYVRLLIAMSASYGLYRALTACTKVFPEIPSEWRFVPGFLRRFPSARLGMMGFVALSLPWCFPYWWEPVRMDKLYVESVPVVSRRLLAMGDALRSTTDTDAVFAAGPSYAPWIPALGGRQVLLAGESVEDAAARERAQSLFVRSQDPAEIALVARRWRLTHLAWGRLDQPASGEEITPVDFDFFERSPLFEERFRDRRWLRVFEYIPRQ